MEREEGLLELLEGLSELFVFFGGAEVAFEVEEGHLPLRTSVMRMMRVMVS